MNKMWYALLILALVLIGSACAQSTSSSPESNQSQQLRLTNVGDEDIQGLIVLFPGSTPAQAARSDFGDVPAGQTTNFQAISTGVYRYAAYEYTLDGETVYQPVIDWVGEQPLEGVRITYELLLDIARVQGDQMQLINVVNDSE